MTPYDKQRAIYMLEVAAQYIEEGNDEDMIWYDDTWCDGACVAEECRQAANAIKEPNQ